VHYHEEYETDRPFYVYTDMIGLFDTYAMLRAKAQQPDTWVVSGHDPAEMSRFEAVGEHCLDLMRPLQPDASG